MTDKSRVPPDDETDPQSEPAPDAGGGGGAVLESPAAAAERLAGELAELNDRHLRLAAEYENFRKRTTRERSELWAGAQAELVARLVDALDDLARFAHVDPVEGNAKALREGVELVERKIWKVLEAFERPWLTAFSDGDPITAGGERIFQHKVPGAKGQPHVTVAGAGHFLQEDAGAEVGRILVDLIERTS